MLLVLLILGPMGYINKNMKLYFLTGNKNKFEEAKAVLGDVEQLDIGLPEIQEIDAKGIIKTKLQEAFNHQKGELLVEDTSLYLNCLAFRGH